MNSARRSILITLLSSNATVLIQFVASILIARVLAPAEIGIYSIAAVLVGMAHLLRDLGTGNYLVREPELSEEKIRAVLGLMLAVSWLVGALLALLSVPAARFYREPQVATVLQLLAFNMLLIPFGSLTLSLLRRNLEAEKQAIAGIGSTLAHSVTAITLAMLGLGALSLAWASIAGTLVSILIATAFRPAGLPWLPSWRGWRAPLNFGLLSTGGAMLDELNRGLYDLMLGRLINMRAVGLFSRAQGTVNLFYAVAGPAAYYTALPFFSRIHHRGAALDEPLLHAMRLLTGVALPFFGVLSGLAPLLIPVLYGHQWDESIALVAPLCLAAALNAPFALNGQVYLALGHPRLVMILAFGTVLIRASGLYLVAGHGLFWVAFVPVAEQLLLIPVHLLLMQRVLGISARQVPAAAGPGLLLGLLLAGIAWIGTALLQGRLPDLLLLALLGGLLGGLYLAGLRALDHPLWPEIVQLGQRLGINRATRG